MLRCWLASQKLKIFGAQKPLVFVATGVAPLGMSRVIFLLVSLCFFKSLKRKNILGASIAGAALLLHSFLDSSVLYSPPGCPGLSVQLEHVLLALGAAQVNYLAVVLYEHLASSWLNAFPAKITSWHEYHLVICSCQPC